MSSLSFRQLIMLIFIGAALLAAVNGELVVSLGAMTFLVGLNWIPGWTYK